MTLIRVSLPPIIIKGKILFYTHFTSTVLHIFIIDALIYQFLKTKRKCSYLKLEIRHLHIFIIDTLIYQFSKTKRKYSYLKHEIRRKKI